MNKVEQPMSIFGTFFKVTIPDFLTKNLKSTIHVGVPPESKELTRVGWYLNTISAQVARVLVSIAGGFVLTYFLAFIFGIFNIQYLNGLWWIIGSAMAITVAWNEPKITVPANHVGIITFLGTRYHVFIQEGDYWWLGQRFFFGISIQPLPKAENVQAGPGEAQGFVFIGKRILQIWNSADSKVKDTVILLQTQGGSTVTSSLDVNTTTIDPIKRARVTDANLRIANTTRTGLRKAAGLIRDTDFNVAKEIVTDLIVGDRVLVVFTLKKKDSYLEGTMVKDNSGSPIYHRLVLEGKPETFPDQIAPQVVEFARLVEQTGNPEQVSVSKRDGNLAVAILDVREKLSPILEEVGEALDNLILSDAQLSGTVREAGEKASSEGYQRTAQVISAQTQQEVAAILSFDSKGEPISDFARALAATADGNKGVSIVMVPGSDPLTRAAIAGGQQIGGKGK